VGYPPKGVQIPWNEVVRGVRDHDLRAISRTPLGGCVPPTKIPPTPKRGSKGTPKTWSHFGPMKPKLPCGSSLKDSGRPLGKVLGSKHPQKGPIWLLHRGRRGSKSRWIWPSHSLCLRIWGSQDPHIWLLQAVDRGADPIPRDDPLPGGLPPVEAKYGV